MRTSGSALRTRAAIASERVLFQVYNDMPSTSGARATICATSAASPAWSAMARGRISSATASAGSLARACAAR